MTTSSPPTSLATTSTAKPRLKTQVSDAFLQARIDSTARPASSPRRISASQSLPALDGVLTDAHLKAPRPRPSSYRTSDSRLGEKVDAAYRKGKSREMDIPEENTKRLPEWVLDLVEARRGAERWADRERVILAVGNPTPETLAPILHNPAFAGTLLLIGSANPNSFDDLLSPSHLLTAGPAFTVYPTIQPFTAGQGLKATLALPAILAQATSLAHQYRLNGRSNGTPRAQARRRDSTASSIVSSPPLTPSISSRKLSSLPSAESISDQSRPHSMFEAIRPELAKGASELSLATPKERPSARSRLSSFGGFSKPDAIESRSGIVNGSPFDAVLNLIPSAADFEPHLALQGMLHQAVVLTTGVLPLIGRSPSRAESSPLPVSVLHILPIQIPTPLPGVIENYLLHLASAIDRRSERLILCNVITPAVWQAVRTEPRGEATATSGRDISGAEVLLYGGVRSTAHINGATGTSGHRPRALLPSWSACVSVPDMISSSQPATSVDSALVYQNNLSDPPAMAYRDVPFRTPPTVISSTTSMTAYDRLSVLNDMEPASTARPASRSKLSNLGARAPPTPDLDPSHSSCSSWSGPPDSGSAGSKQGLDTDPQIVAPDGSFSDCGKDRPTERPAGGKRSLSSWFKSKPKSVKA